MATTTPPPSTKPFTIAIVGGGIAGLTFAIALINRGINVKIYEQAPKFGEIGAGVSFTDNAVQSMDICGPAVHEAFDKVATRNGWESKRKVWFDYLDGTASGDPAKWEGEGTKKHQKPEFVIRNSLGQNGVHRAHFLDELVKLVPKEYAEFGKRLARIDQPADGHGKLTLHFEDGTSAEADAVVGCDGIKSKVRAAVVGHDHPSLKPVYSHKYAYRAIVPIEKAIEILGEENAMNACMHMGPGAHMLTFLVQHGKFLNIVAFKTNSDDWPDYQRLTRPAKREDALRDFSDFGPSVTELLKLAKADLDCWAIFDLHAHPLPTMNNARVIVIGDAAHATSPHHGAGAGFAIEDAAILAEMLSDPHVTSTADISTVFAAFNECRKERGQWLVRSSRIIGDSYEWRAEGIGKDFAKIEENINTRNGIIADVDVKQMCRDARELLGRRLGEGKESS